MKCGPAAIEVDSLLGALVASLELWERAPGDMIFAAGEPSDALLFVHDGSAASTDGSTFEPGAFIGEMEFHVGGLRSWSARAGPSGCSGAALTRKMLQVFEKEEPRLALLAQKIALYSEQIRQCLLQIT